MRKPKTGYSPGLGSGTMAVRDARSRLEAIDQDKNTSLQDRTSKVQTFEAVAFVGLPAEQWTDMIKERFCNIPGI